MALTANHDRCFKNTCAWQLLAGEIEAPDHQSMGLGRHLLAQAETMIAGGGNTDFELHARIDNLAAIGFYERAGWTVTDRLIHTVEHAISYDEHVLVKHRS